MSFLLNPYRFGSIAPPDIPQSLFSKVMHWWDFDATLTDQLSGLTLVGTGTYTPGLVGNRVVKGALLYRRLPSSPNIASSGSVLTIGGWYRAKATTDEDIMGVHASTDSTNNPSFYIGKRSSSTQISLVAFNTGGTTFTVTATAPATEYIHVHAEFDSTTKLGELWVNSVSQGTFVLTGTPRAAGSVSFGRRSPAVSNAVDNDSSYVSYSHWTQDEIDWVYNSGAGRGSSELMAGDPYGADTVGPGAWTWFTDPRGSRPGTQLVVGSVSDQGHIRAYYSNDDLATPASAFELATAYSPVDDHDNPAFLHRSDSKLLAFYSRHNDTNTWLRISTNNNDASAWGAAVNLQPQYGGTSFSYSNPVQLTGETNEPIYNFFRRGTAPNWTMHQSVSNDGGTTWSAATALLGAGRPYFKIYRNGTTRIDFMVTDGHPGEVSTNGVYHFYYQGGSYFDSFGVALGATPFATSSLTQLWDGSTAAGRGWIWDLVTSGSNPVAVYSNFPSTSDHRYRYARWTGSAWIQSEVCAAGGALYAGEPYYSGGICIDPDNINVVYASRQVAGEWGLYRYVTADGGSTWDSGTLVYKRAGRKVFRPVIVPGSGRLLFCDGLYATFSDYATLIRSMQI